MGKVKKKKKAAAAFIDSDGAMAMSLDNKIQNDWVAVDSGDTTPQVQNHAMPSLVPGVTLSASRYNTGVSLRKVKRSRVVSTKAKLKQAKSTERALVNVEKLEQRSINVVTVKCRKEANKHIY